MEVNKKCIHEFMAGRTEGTRVAIFFDMQNLYYQARNVYKKKVDYLALLDLLLCGRTLVKAVGYGVKGNNPGEERFFEALRNAGMEMRLRNVHILLGGKRKANWDVGMTIDIMKTLQEENIDVVILASGDGDFKPLADEIRQKGKIIEVAAFGAGMARALSSSAHSFMDLNRYQEVLH